MYQNSCWGTDSWWIIILFAILLIWLCGGNQCGYSSNQCGYGNTLDCCNGCCH
ncbi:MAG: hypothetical protein KHY77_02525 [Butyricicoccus pullicaecorum]|nr:hypothetical protein [Butyricicoccus pullicaecorum]